MTSDWAERIEIPGAINVMALQVIAAAVEDYACNGWGDYPDIADRDWQRIITRARELSRPPAAAHRDRAYSALARHAGTGFREGAR